jgi:hypothetical protein
MQWRTKLAEIAGLPPLDLMEGFWQAGSHYDPRTYIGAANDSLLKSRLDSLFVSLPIRWDALKPDPLYKLLYHSDCDGEIAAKDCLAIAKRLEQLIPLLPDDDAGGHIGVWKDKTKQFAKGLRRAHRAKEALIFH